MLSKKLLAPQRKLESQRLRKRVAEKNALLQAQGEEIASKDLAASQM